MAVAVLFTASCAKEEISSSIAGGEVEVTFTASLPELGTRAFGEGKLAKQLTVNVYEHGTNEALTALNRTETSETGVFTFQLVLLKGMKYDIVLWAQNATCGHYTLVNKVVTMDYTDVNANDETRDAFYFYVEGFDPAVDTPSFALTRPFAQLNAAVNQSDMTAVSNSKVELTTSTVKVKTYTTLNIATGEVGGETEVEFVPTAMPKETFNTDYTLLSMNYILVPQDAVNAKMVSDVEFTFNANKNGSESAFSGTKYFSVPLKRNYRTNILGSLLTKPTDFTVTIDAVFDVPAEEVVVKPWDGTTEAVTPDANGVYSVSTANQLAWLAEQVNAGNDFAGKTINLTNDIDLNNIPWTPIGLGELDPQFKGTLDGAKATRSGDCYVIRNLYVAPTKGEYTAAGLFGRLNGCVKNLVIDGAYIEHVTSGNSYGSTTNGIAVVAGSTYNTSFETSVENVTVKNAVVKGNRYVAGIIGFADSSVKDCTVEDSEFILSCDNLTGSYDNADKGGSIVGYSNTNRPVNVTGCVAKNVTITGYRDLGGIIGYARGTISGNTVEGVKLVVDNTHNYKNYTAAAQYDLGSYYGEKDSAAVVENNTGEAEVVIEAIGLSIADQLKVKNATVTLPNGTYDDLLTWEIADGVTIVGESKENVIVKIPAQLRADNKTLTLKNLTTTVPTGLYYAESTFAFIHYYKQFNMIDCISDGRIRLNCYAANIQGCTFNVTTSSGFDGYAIFYYGPDNSTVNVKDCEFNTAGKAIVVYSESAKAYNLNVDDCTFVSSDPSTDKAAVQMHTEYGITGVVKINNSTATGFKNINYGLLNELNNNTKALTNNFEKWIDGKEVYGVIVSDVNGIKEAVKAGANAIGLTAGTYDAATFGFNGKTLSFKGVEDGAKIFVNQNNAVALGTFDSCKVSFEDLTIATTGGIYKGFARMEGKYTNCKFEKLYFTLYGKHEFINCEFDAQSDEHCMWTYGANDVSFKGCKFNYSDRCVNVYVDNGDDSAKVLFDDCEFVTANAGSKGAVEINSSAFPKGVTIDFVNDCAAPAYGEMAFISGWDSANGANATVTINGVETTVPQLAK